MPARDPKPVSTGLGFLLSQLGHRAATLFAELLIPLDMTPPLAGIVRLVAVKPGLSQQELAQQLNLLPSCVVSFVAHLEARGHVTRERNANDRRLYALHLTPSGERLMTELGAVAREHDRRLAIGLSKQKRDELRTLLAGLAEAQSLTPAVHPGYRDLSAET